MTCGVRKVLHNSCHALQVIYYVHSQVSLAALRHARSSFGLSVQARELEDALHYAFTNHAKFDDATNNAWSESPVGDKRVDDKF